jgi:hypothetical protein
LLQNEFCYFVKITGHFAISFLETTSFSCFVIFLLKRNKIACLVCFATRFAKFLTFELLKLTSPIEEPILYDKDLHMEVRVAEPHHVDAVPGKNFDAAPAPTLLYTKPTFFKQAEVFSSISFD